MSGCWILIDCCPASPQRRRRLSSCSFFFFFFFGGRITYTQHYTMLCPYIYRNLCVLFVSFVVHIVQHKTLFTN